jgi:hypothetical protein
LLPPDSRLVRPSAWFSLVALTCACHAQPDIRKKPKKACREAETALDHAIGLQDYAGARSLRSNTYALCGPRAELEEQDRRIVDGEARLAAAAAARSRDERELGDALRVFLDFVAERRATPERASLYPVCDQETHQAPRFCVARRSIGRDYPIEVRYGRDDSGTFRFTLGVKGAVACARIGGTPEQTWRVPLPGGGTTERSRCALAGALAGLEAVVSASAPSSVQIVSPSYLGRDPGARQALEPP